MRIALAIDLGGTETRAALVGEDGRILAEERAPTRADAGPDAVIADMAAMAGRLRATLPTARPVGIGVGAPGPLDGEAGISIAPPTLAGWRDVPLADRLAEATGLATKVENDANAAALGEWRFGAGRGTRDIVFVTVSTGIGGGIISGGQMLRGRRGLAGEIGHMTIASESPQRCACGAYGCFEALASGTALGQAGAALAKAGGSRELLSLSGGGRLTARHVGQAARAGDAGALALLDQEAHWLGIGFTNLLHLYSPERIVVGGGVGQLLDLLLPGIREVIESRAMTAYRDVPVVPAELGDRAGLVGAAGLVL